MPAAKLPSMPPQATPMATPAAATSAAKVVVSTPKKPRMATISTTFSAIFRKLLRYRAMVTSKCRSVSARDTSRSATLISARPTNHRMTAPSTRSPT